MLAKIASRTLLALLLAIATAMTAAAQTKLLRFPDLYGEQVVFSYAGDLWLASAEGGTATRLTAHPGLEVFPKFSPDGSHIAFTGQYDGDEQVYVIPTAGGAPRQLTFYPAAGPLPPRWGYDNQVYGWTPDGKAVLFRSLRDTWDVGESRLYTVALTGGLPEALPMPASGAGDLSPDGSRVVYSPLFRDFRHWKRYQGGWAQDLYIFDRASHDALRLTDHPRSDRDPMWIGERIYFSSDRTGTLNLYSVGLAGGEPDQLTTSDVWDVRWPSADAEHGKIVYELNGELVIFDIATGQSKPISIRVPTDGVAMRPSHLAVGDQVSDFRLGPKGKRVLFTARGDIFSAPVEHGPVRNLTRSSGANDRQAAWSPDGSTIAFTSDMAGEDELYLIASDGMGEPRKLLATDKLGKGRFLDLLWSPDNHHLAFRNQQSKLFVVDTKSAELIEIADDPAVFGLSYSWSPHGGHLAYSLAEENGLGSLYIWTLADRTSRKVSDGFFNQSSPVFGPKGDYLFFLSDREFAPQLGSFEFNYVVDRETCIYAMALRRDVPHPFPPRSDEVGEAEDDDKADKADKADKGDKGKEEKGKKKKQDSDETAKAEAEKPIRIDFDGIVGRVARVPVDADNYFAVVAVDGALLYVRGVPAYYGRSSDKSVDLRKFSFDKREETTLASGIDGLDLSPDGSQVLISQRGQYQVFDSTGDGQKKKTVSTSGLEVDRVPAEEWTQIFNEAWRRFRDFFYVENMHGYDWEALRERYRPQLAHVGHRADLSYVMSEMIAELNVSHAYVAGGDLGMPPRPHPALLGARFALDETASRYRISAIFAGQNEENRYRSPLTEIGVDVAPGTYVLAINGTPLTGDDNPFRLLRHAGGEVVELTVNDRPSLEGARRVLVRPIDDEDNLIYLAWVEENRRKVTAATGGKVGYIHLPDMGSDGLQEFIKGYYPQLLKQGLIIDVRSNGGGNVSSMLIERLRRKILMFDFERNQELADPYPSATFNGHLVCLLDEDTASDGDQFAYVFRAAGLGPLIGKRSWGGVVGIYGGAPLIDGGTVSVPEAGSAGADGNWVIEGEGVSPDIEVENEPKELLRGRDQQLEKAIEVLLAKIAEDPRTLPGRPAPPVKTEKKAAVAQTYTNTLRWSTASEVDNFGFDIYRGESEEGPFERINSQPIPGAGTTDEPTKYEYVDDTIDPRKTYYYYVESISLSNARERFTPIYTAKPKV